MSKQKGFTLIELMVAIMIIGIISAVGLVSYSKAQSVARDAKRKSDLRSIATALELYRQQNKRYPCTGNGVWRWSAGGGIWITDAQYASCGGASQVDLGTTYINRNPVDPINNAGGTGNPPLGAGLYGYGYRENCQNCGCPASLNGKYFILYTKLENVNDPDALNAAAGKNIPLECNGTQILWPDGTFAITSNG